MTSRALKNRAFIVAAILIFLALGFTSGAHAAETAGRFHVQGSLFLGEGITDIDIGTTTVGDKVTISGGGGLGGGLTLGYGLTQHLDVDVTAGYQESGEVPAVYNGSGTFRRSFYIAMIKYRIPVAEWFHVKLGAGGGLYVPGELDLDFDAAGVVNGAHDIISYNNAFGGNLSTELEFFVTGNSAVSIGWKYYYVMYEEDTATHNGQKVFFTESNIKNLDGSGVDFILSFAKYF